MKNLAIRKHDGFTLIEAMAGMAICGLIISSGMFLTGMTSRSTSQKIQSTRAYFALQNFMEGMQVSTNSDGSLDQGTHGPVAYDISGNLLTSPTGPVVITWINTVNKPIGGIEQISVTATWTDTITNSQTMTIYRKMPVTTSPITTQIIPLTTPAPSYNAPVPACVASPTLVPPVCQTGTQTVVYSCVDTANSNSTLPPSACAAAGLGSCTNTTSVGCTAVPLTYSWYDRGILSCDLDTHLGVEWIYCVTSWGASTSDAMCLANGAGPKPPTNVACSSAQ